MEPSADAPAPEPVRLALAIDASEWFHDPVLAEHLARRHWRRLASRSAQALEAALALCARHRAQATFFVTGELAERHPELLRAIVQAGHEVASAGGGPVDLEAVAVDDRPALLAAWQSARSAIEVAIGQTVRGFRIAWPAAGRDVWWRTAVLASYAYEATAVGPSRHSDGLQAVEVHTSGGTTATALVGAVWQLDAERPPPVGLPRAVVQQQFAAAARLRADLVARCAVGGLRSVAEVLELPAAAVVAKPLDRGAVTLPSPPSLPPPPRTDVPRLGIVVPLKDEEAGVPSLFVELDALTVRLRDLAACEFIFVDDGSTDRTAALLAERIALRPHTRLVRHPHNQGVAAAIRTGLLATDAPLVASIDGDLSYDPFELAAMLPLLDGADVVTASPYHPAGGVRHVPGWRLVLSRTLSRAYQRLLRSDIRTWTSCFRLYRRSAVAELPLTNPGFLGTAELLVRVLRRGGRVREHPCVLEARLLGVSKMRVLRTMRGHVRLLWQVWRGTVK